MDHTGAILGPLIATAILFFAPGEYRLLFGLTLIPGAIAVALLFLVPEPISDDRRVRCADPGLRIRMQARRSGRARQTPTRRTTARTPARVSRRPARLQPWQFRRRLPAAAPLRRARRRDLHPAAVGRSPRRQGVAVDVGRRAVGSPRPQARDHRRLDDLRRGLPRVRHRARRVDADRWFLVYGSISRSPKARRKRWSRISRRRAGRGPRSASTTRCSGLARWPRAWHLDFSTSASAHPRRLAPVRRSPALAAALLSCIRTRQTGML